MTTEKNQIDLIVEDLFTNGSGEKADRLVMTADGPPQRGLGGWSRRGMASRLKLLMTEGEPPAIAALVEALAVRHHKEVEGEYGCGYPQSKCPGVLRLIDRLNRALEGEPLHV